MRTGYFVDTLFSVDIQGVVKIGREVNQIYERVLYRENIENINI